ncbi:sodium channel protein Nach [Chironomus tepperi]|uniref:sodium channel protein Nach n=1 Tax=Chironomus tepperi TaxID=113505 RepID=UPI00391F88D4
MGIFQEYMLQSSLHGAKYVVDKEKYSFYERIFWTVCIILSWVGSVFLILASLDAFNNNAISFVVESSYRDWDTDFPAVFLCENKNMDRVQEAADRIFGEDHDFTLEEVLSEIAYFRGESYHTIHECTGEVENINLKCILGNYSHYAGLVRSSCENSLAECTWNDVQFECCKHFIPLSTEIGECFALNSEQTIKPKNYTRLNMMSNRYVGPGVLKIKILTESFLYTIGTYEVPNLVTPKTDILQIDQFINYKRHLSVKNVENDIEARDVSIEQRKCRFPDENYLDVHKYYSFSACSAQCRKDEQMRYCGCNSHVMPNTNVSQHCDIDGLVCLNEHYEDLSIVIAPWSRNRKKRGVVCDCMPSCNEIDLVMVHEVRDNIFDPNVDPYSIIELSLAFLPTERFKRNVVRGKLDLVVSIGGSTGLFVGASLLSFVEIVYYFTIRAGIFSCLTNFFKKKIN